MNDRKLIDIIREGSYSLQPIATGLQPRGEPRDRVAAVLLDVYGTLLISGSGDSGLSEKTYRDDGRLGRLLDRHGVRRAPGEVRDAFVRSVRAVHEDKRRQGIPFPEVRVERIWMDVLGFDADAARLFAVEYEIIVNPVWHMPGLEALVDRIRRCAAGRLAAGLISNAQFFTPLQLSCFLGDPPEKAGFAADLLFYSYRTGHAKPSPVLHRAAGVGLAERGIEGRNVLCMGNDMLNDIFPAVQAGFQTALFAGDGRSLRLREDDPRCRGLEPDLVVTDLRQLADHLGI